MFNRLSSVWKKYIEDKMLQTVLQYELKILFIVTINIKMVIESA